MTNVLIAIKTIISCIHIESIVALSNVSSATITSNIQ